MARKYLLTTLGCKVNQYESQQLREVLEAHGYRPAQRGDTPDIAVVNTCAVTENAARKNRQAIRRASRQGRVPVVVVGCGVMAEADRLRRLDGVAAVLGHDVDIRAALVQILATSGKAAHPDCPEQTTGELGYNSGRPDAHRKKVWNNSGIEQLRRVTTTSRTSKLTLPIVPPSDPVVKNTHTLAERIESFGGHQRAFLKVQDGCDAFCTYCIIPRLRPTMRDKPIETAVAEARDLVQAGHREIILTGIFLGAFGRATAIRKRWTRQSSPLVDLVTALAQVDGLERLRLSSLEPGDVDDALLEAIAAHDVCVPHLHLPLQSGSGGILKRMNRQYTRDDFVAMIDRVRTTLDHAAITTDIIVGFPGERNEDFEATLDTSRYAGFSKIHAFPYSRREGTPAAGWSDRQVPNHVAAERMARLSELECSLSLAYRQSLVGRTERIIVERTSASLGAASIGDDVSELTIVTGRADRYFEIVCEDNQAAPGAVLSVRIDRVTPSRTHGTVIESVRPQAAVTDSTARDRSFPVFVQVHARA